MFAKHNTPQPARIAVDHALVMGVLDGLAALDHKAHAPGNVQPVAQVASTFAFFGAGRFCLLAGGGVRGG
jgi:hypothetical protein